MNWEGEEKSSRVTLVSGCSGGYGIPTGLVAKIGFKKRGTYWISRKQYLSVSRRRFPIIKRGRISTSRVDPAWMEPPRQRRPSIATQGRPISQHAPIGFSENNI